MSEHPTCVYCGEKAQFEIDGVWVCFSCDPYTIIKEKGVNMLQKNKEEKGWYDPENLPEVLEDYVDENDRYFGIEEYPICGLNININGIEKSLNDIHRWVDLEDTLTLTILNRLYNEGINIYKSNRPTGKFDYKLFECKTEKIDSWDVSKAFDLLYNSATLDKTLILYKVLLEEDCIYVRYALV